MFFFGAVEYTAGSTRSFPLVTTSTWYAEPRGTIDGQLETAPLVIPSALPVAAILPKNAMTSDLSMPEGYSMLPVAVNHANRLANYTVGMETIGDRIRQQREAKGLSLQQLADLLGVTKAAVSHWELGRTANIKNVTMYKLLGILGCSQEYLLYGASRGAPGKPPGGARGAGSGNQPT